MCIYDRPSVYDVVTASLCRRSQLLAMPKAARSTDKENTLFAFGKG